MHSSLL